MNEMVERVAREIVQSEGLGDASMPQGRKFALIAIAEIRKFLVDYYHSATDWPAVIDAALEESKDDGR